MHPAFQLNIGREAVLLQDAKRRDPDPDTVAYLRGELDALAGEAKYRDANGWEDPTIFVTVQGDDSMALLVYPDETAEFGVETPERLRGVYRLNLDAAALVVATVGDSLELGE